MTDEAGRAHDSEPHPSTVADGARRGQVSEGGGRTSGGHPVPATSSSSAGRSSGGPSVLRRLWLFVREIIIIILVALIASALLRAFVVQAFFVPSGSMLPEIQLNDRILVSRIGDIERGEVVVFEDPGGWIPPGEQAPPPGPVHQGLEWIGVLPASGHEHLVKRVIGLPGDHVVCCSKGKVVINGVGVDESAFIKPGGRAADNVKFDVVVPADHIFVLGDNRYMSGDSSRHIQCGQPEVGFIPFDLVTGRAFAVVWPARDLHILHVPDAYQVVPGGRNPPSSAVVNVDGQRGSCSTRQ